MDTPLLYWQDLTRRLEPDQRVIKISGQVQAGGTIAVQGPSGSGKSTILRVMARLITAHGGEMFLQGTSWKEITPSEWRMRLQYLSQKPILFDGTVEENLRMPFTFKSVSQKRSFQFSAAAAYLDQLQLSNKLLQQEARTLSGGEAARISLIRALLIEPEILLLDEPTAYLDGDNRERLMTLLRQWVAEERRAIIMVSHSEQDLVSFPGCQTLDVTGREVI